MREFKFRAWHDGGKHPEEAEMIYDNPHHVFKWLYEGQPVTVMQFTGLKDKNGVDIYEGDIVNGWTHNPLGFHVIEYISDKYNCGFMARDIDGLGKIHVWYDGLEVIGNIHESPELLKTPD